MKILYGRFVKAATKTTSKNEKVTEVTVQVTQYDAATKKEHKVNKTVAYFNIGNSKRADWAEQACAKFKDKDGIILSYTEKGDNLYGDQTPRNYGFITVPPALREATEEDKQAAVEAVKAAAAAGGIEGYTFNPDELEDVKNAYALLQSLENNDVTALKAIRKIMYTEKNVYIGTISYPYVGDNFFRCSIALPKKAAEDKTERASVTFFSDMKDRCAKCLASGARAVLFLGEKTVRKTDKGEYVNFVGSNFSMITFAPKEEKADGAAEGAAPAEPTEE